MAQTVEIIQAKVKFPCWEPKQTQFGLRINCVCVTESGEEIKLWGNPDDPIKYLKKGESVILTRDQKGVKLASTSIPKEAKIAAEGNSVPDIKSPQIDPIEALKDPDRNGKIKTYVRWHSKLLKECLQQAKEICEPFDEHSEPLLNGDENIRAVGITLYLQAIKKFDL